MLRDTLLGIRENLSDANKNVKWLVWKEFDWIKDGKVIRKRWQRVTESGTIKDLVKYLLDIATQFIPHAFVKREQSKRYQVYGRERRNNANRIGENNPVCVYQKQIQRAHYNQNQFALLTAASWICKKT